MKYKMNIHKNVGISFLLLLVFMTNSSGFAQPIQETPVSKLARQLIASVNSGNAADQRQFISEHIDSQALNNGPDGVLKQFSDLYTQTGGVNIVSLEPGRDSNEARLILTSKRGDVRTELLTRLSRDSPQKLIGFMSRPVEASSVGATSTWPQTRLPEPAIIREIEKHLEQASKDDHFSGVVLIAKEDHILLNKAYGLADQEKGILNRTTTKFNLGSMNKMFTSVAIAQLVAAGKLSFSDTLSHILTDYPNQAVAKTITIHQLLTHTAGLGDFFKPDFFAHRENYVRLSSYLPLFSQDSLSFKPGTNWSYSNAGFLILGLVVEKISGESYFDYVRTHIFIPAGMNNTDAYERDVPSADRALGYTSGGETYPKHKPMPRRVNQATLPLKGSSAGGGYSTTADLFLFCQALLSHRLLNAELTKTITTGKVNDHRPDSQYAYGFTDRTRLGKHLVGHGGGGPGINGNLTLLKDNGYTVIVLSNYDPPAADNLAAEISDFLIHQ